MCYEVLMCQSMNKIILKITCIWLTIRVMTVFFSLQIRLPTETDRQYIRCLRLKITENKCRKFLIHYIY